MVRLQDPQDEDEIGRAIPGSAWQRVKQSVDTIGGPGIFAFKVLRLGCVVGLCVFTSLSAARGPGNWYNIAFTAAAVSSHTTAIRNITISNAYM